MRYVGFVRNVMLGREGLHRTVLLDLVARAGGGSAVSYITTGNVGFDAEPDRLAAVVADLEGGIAGVIGRHEPVFVRTVDALRTMVDAEPFAGAPEAAVERVVSFARDPIPIPTPMPWWSKRRDVVVFRIDGTEAYAASLLVDGRTTGGGGYCEQLAGQLVTTRSWGTITRIVRREAR